MSGRTRSRKRARHELDQETLQKHWKNSVDFKFRDLVTNNSKKIAVSQMSLLARRSTGQLFWFQKGNSSCLSSRESVEGVVEKPMLELGNV